MKNFYRLLVILITTLTNLNPILAHSESLDPQEDASIYPLSYQLNAIDPHNLAQFYQEAMGMTAIEVEDNYYRLATSAGETLLEIFPATIPHGQTLNTGVYHVVSW